MDLTSAPPADPLAIALARELRHGERLLWQGRPLARISVRAFGIYFFAVPWTAFALFWTFLAAGGTAAMRHGVGWISLAFPLFGLPFIAIGVGMLAAPFAPLFMAPRTLFAVTGERLIRIGMMRRLHTQSVPVTRIGTLDRSEAADGSGTLTIVTGSRYDGDGDKVTEKFTIGEVSNVIAVEQHIRSLLTASPASA